MLIPGLQRHRFIMSPPRTASFKTLSPGPPNPVGQPTTLPGSWMKCLITFSSSIPPADLSSWEMTERGPPAAGESELRAQEELCAHRSHPESVFRGIWDVCTAAVRAEWSPGWRDELSFPRSKPQRKDFSSIIEHREKGQAAARGAAWGLGQLLGSPQGRTRKT